jgi:predicted Zn-dependent peptidase
LQAKPVGRAELARAKSQLKGNLMLGLESTSSRMSKLAKDEMYYGRHVPLREIMADIDAVSVDQLSRLSRELLDDRHLTVTALGPLKKKDVECVMQ